MNAEPAKKRMSFEKALERLETLVQEMESGALSLEKMMAHFEEGMDLVKFCSAKLNEVERKIEILVKKGETLVAEPFEPQELATDAAAAPTSEETADDEDGEAAAGTQRR